MNERDIFIEALQKDPGADRSAYLAAACADNQDLRHDVERLLHEHLKTGPFVLDTPPPGLGRTDDEIPACPGTLIGRYKLLELIGEGGFGDVYMAEQQEPVRRKVALKIIKLGMDTRAVIARFEAERQALALMNHPNIAKVLDAGAMESGRPYFVMDLVRGIPITEYSDQNSLSTKERLALFIDVCQAVQHAHQKGIIHRDIKSTNVLVTQQDGRPVPRIIDFGVAKATQQRLTEKTLFTEHRQLVGTPEYMSPEQATFCEADVDTRSDIYSLGVLLYELLVGTTPFDAEALRSRGYDEICRVIRESDPPTPSKRLSTLGDAEVTDISMHRRVEPSALRKLFRGDLDWIVMKALEKDRTRRYETAHGLARDIERHLNDEPVRARPPSAGYRLKKFVRKHRMPVTAAAATMAALVLGLILMSVGFLRADRERQIAANERDRADALTRQTRRQLYVSDVNSAYHAWEEGNIDRARELLSRHAQTGEEDLRGFEWRYLWGKYQRRKEIPTLQHKPITSIAFSPDGAVLASSAWDHTVKLWDVAAREALHTLKQEDRSLDAAFSPDGKLIACGSGKSVNLWDVASGTLIAALPHRQEVACVAFSPDGRVLAAGCGRFIGGEIKLWNVATRAEEHVFSGHTACVSDVTFSPDGETLASGSEDRTVRLWDIKTRTEIKTITAHKKRVIAVAFSPNGTMLASGGWGGAVKLWDTSTHDLAAAAPLGAAFSVAFSPDGEILAVGSGAGMVRLWDMTTRRFQTYHSGHSSDVESVAFSPDGTALATGSEDGTVKIANVAAFQADSFHDGHNEWTSRIAVSSGDPMVLAVGCGEVTTNAASGEILLWDLATREARSLAGEDTGPVRDVAISPDGQVLATGERVRGSSRGVVKLWDVPSGKLLRTLEGHASAVRSVAFSPDGKTLASGDWGCNEGKTPNSGDWGATIKLWDVDAEQPRQTLRTQRCTAMMIAFSPDGKTLAVGGGRWSHGEITLWKPASGKAPITLAGPAAMVFGVAFSPDGGTLASADWDGGVWFWDVANGRQRLALDAHASGLLSVAFSPDGKTLASGRADGTVKLWHVPTGDELATLRAHKSIFSVAFFPNGDTLAAGGMDKSVTLWHVNAEKEVLRAR